ncbi:MAG: ATP-grasp domain-containing protein [Bdellovibrionales bacterium]|nr:ATP-grasp domain-containing protein [Bdellovibrionales bacterium]
MKILVLMHKDLMPPSKSELKGSHAQQGQPWETEYDVVTTLKEMEHNVHEVGVISDLSIIRKSIEEFKPKVIFNLLEEFNGEAVYDQNVVSYLELLDVAYTGCSPRGLMLARDKALSKKILTYHKIKTPKFQEFSRRKKQEKLKLKKFPLIVKCQNEEASLGISMASVVNTEEKVIERVSYIHGEFHTDAIVEEFIPGTELYVGVIGNSKLQTLPVWQLYFDDVDNPDKEIYSEQAKFNSNYRKRKGIRTGPADIPKDLAKQVTEVAKKTYRALDLNGYARIDLRVSTDERIFVLEANPNPDISMSDEFAMSAKKAKMSYQQLLSKIISLSV